jgi:DNA polymerase-1
MDKVTQEMRRNAKAVNFGIVYGISDFGLSRDLGISRKDAKRYIEKYFERYPKVALYMENIAKDARDKGYVSTVLNRRRYLPNLFSPNQIIRNAAERTAMNTPIQGSAADIIKLAMLKIADMTEKNKSAVMLLQVHDELIFRVKKDKLDEIAEMVIGIMENAYKISVPLKVDVKYGDNWYDLKKYN